MRRGKTKRGRPRKKWMEEIHTMSGMNLGELRDVVEVRDVWRKLTISIARTLRVEGTRGLLQLLCRALEQVLCTQCAISSPSFIQTISIASLQVHFYSEVLPTQHGYCAGVSH